VVIGYLNEVSALVRPHEADAILIIDADAMLTSSGTAELLNAVPTRTPQIRKIDRRLQVLQLALGNTPNRAWASFTRWLRIFIVEHVLTSTIPEADDHSVFPSTACT
jgi:hypothetical protein